jgi:AcrR family transcriptional regulator
VSVRSADTRRALLTAAEQVFTASGYADASIADVVAGAGGSVGSLYHHFGGKADLYVALYEDFNARQETRSASAVLWLRAAGEQDPGQLFLAGGRAYLLGCWSERQLAQLFHAGDGPPGFTVIARQRHRDWTRQNHSLLHAGDDDVTGALVLVLTTVLSQAGHEVSLQDDEAAATRLTEDVLGIVAKIVAG